MQNCEIAKSAKLQNCKIAKYAKLQNCKIAKYKFNKICKIAKNAKYAKLQNCKIWKMQKYTFVRLYEFFGSSAPRAPFAWPKPRASTIPGRTPSLACCLLVS